MAKKKKMDALDVLITLGNANMALLAIDSAYASEVQAKLAKVLNDTIDRYIPPREAFTDVQLQVLHRHYFAGQSLREVATACKLSYDYVRSVNVAVKSKLASLTMEDMASAFDEAGEL